MLWTPFIINISIKISFLCLLPCIVHFGMSFYCHIIVIVVIVITVHVIIIFFSMNHQSEWKFWDDHCETVFQYILITTSRYMVRTFPYSKGSCLNAWLSLKLDKGWPLSVQNNEIILLIKILLSVNISKDPIYPTIIYFCQLNADYFIMLQACQTWSWE